MPDFTTIAPAAPSGPSGQFGSIAPFSDLGAHDVLFAGGKGANLGELTRAGFRVPPGFVIGAPAYLAAMDEGGVRADLVTLHRSIDADDAAALAAAPRGSRSWCTPPVCPGRSARSCSRPFTRSVRTCGSRCGRRRRPRTRPTCRSRG